MKKLLAAIGAIATIAIGVCQANDSLQLIKIENNQSNSPLVIKGFDQQYTVATCAKGEMSIPSKFGKLELEIGSRRIATLELSQIELSRGSFNQLRILGVYAPYSISITTYPAKDAPLSFNVAAYPQAGYVAAYPQAGYVIGKSPGLC